MAKTVQLSDNAYATLTALKNEGESYSDTVLRLARRGKDPLALLKLGPMRKDFDLVKLREMSRQRDIEKMRKRTERP